MKRWRGREKEGEMEGKRKRESSRAGECVRGLWCSAQWSVQCNVRGKMHKECIRNNA